MGLPELKHTPGQGLCPQTWAGGAAAAAFPVPSSCSTRRRWTRLSSKCPGISWSIIRQEICLSERCCSCCRPLPPWCERCTFPLSPSLQPRVRVGTRCLFWLLSDHDSFARAQLSSHLFFFLLLPLAWRAGQGWYSGPQDPRCAMG